jgi:predicted RNA-binding Zn-ribbon protein involved in translation (DUF1610 family)
MTETMAGGAPIRRSRVVEAFAVSCHSCGHDVEVNVAAAVHACTTCGAALRIEWQEARQA